MHQPKKRKNPKVTIISSKGANQAINYLLEDRDQLNWLVAIGRNRKGGRILLRHRRGHPSGSWSTGLY